MAEKTVVKPVSAEVEKQDRKRKKADVSSDLETSCPDTDLSYLDLDSGKVIPAQSTPQPQSVKLGVLSQQICSPVKHMIF